MSLRRLDARVVGRAVPGGAGAGCCTQKTGAADARAGGWVHCAASSGLAHPHSAGIMHGWRPTHVSPRRAHLISCVANVNEAREQHAAHQLVLPENHVTKQQARAAHQAVLTSMGKFIAPSRSLPGLRQRSAGAWGCACCAAACLPTALSASVVFMLAITPLGMASPCSMACALPLAHWYAITLCLTSRGGGIRRCHQCRCGSPHGPE